MSQACWEPEQQHIPPLPPCPKQSPAVRRTGQAHPRAPPYPSPRPHQPPHTPRPSSPLPSALSTILAGSSAGPVAACGSVAVLLFWGADTCPPWCFLG